MNTPVGLFGLGEGSADWHLPPEVLRRYGAPLSHPTDVALPPAQAAAVEAHLDACTVCCRQLGEVLPAVDNAFLRQVGEQVGERVAGAVQYPRAVRWRVRLTAGMPTAWLIAAVAVAVLAAVLGVASQQLGDAGPPILLLLAPVVPLLGVAAAWTPQLDPMHELTCSTPVAGLGLVMRRTLVVLVTVVPILAAAGAFGGGASVAGWLLPCLALTALALALGSLVGLERAAAGLGASWTLAVVTPAIATQQIPTVVEASTAPAWFVVLLVAAGALWVRRMHYQQTTATAFSG